MKLLICAVCSFAYMAVAVRPADAQQPDWRQVLKQRIPLYGHRNWIVIADSAYPAQSRDGIETIISNSGEFDVLKEVLSDLSSSRHVRAVPYLDRELEFVDEADAPGVTNCRKQLFALLPDAKGRSLPHEEIIHKLDEAGQTFRILIIKTNMTIPYTSVFLQLNCAYWSDEAEQKLRAAMQQSSR